jgi:hypothetical protein
VSEKYRYDALVHNLMSALVAVLLAVGFAALLFWLRDSGKPGARAEIGEVVSSATGES